MPVPAVLLAGFIEAYFATDDWADLLAFCDKPIKTPADSIPVAILGTCINLDAIDLNDKTHFDNICTAINFMDADHSTLVTYTTLSGEDKWGLSFPGPIGEQGWNRYQSIFAPVASHCLELGQSGRKLPASSEPPHLDLAASLSAMHIAMDRRYRHDVGPLSTDTFDIVLRTSPSSSGINVSIPAILATALFGCPGKTTRTIALGKISAHEGADLSRRCSVAAVVLAKDFGRGWGPQNSEQLKQAAEVVKFAISRALHVLDRPIPFKTFWEQVVDLATGGEERETDDARGGESSSSASDLKARLGIQDHLGQFVDAADAEAIWSSESGFLDADICICRGDETILLPFKVTYVTREQAVLVAKCMNEGLGSHGNMKWALQDMADLVGRARYSRTDLWEVLDGCEHVDKNGVHACRECGRDVPCHNLTSRFAPRCQHCLTVDWLPNEGRALSTVWPTVGGTRTGFPPHSAMDSLIETARCHASMLRRGQVPGELLDLSVQDDQEFERGVRTWAKNASGDVDDAVMGMGDLGQLWARHGYDPHYQPVFVRLARVKSINGVIYWYHSLMTVPTFYAAAVMLGTRVLSSLVIETYMTKLRRASASESDLNRMKQLEDLQQASVELDRRYDWSRHQLARMDAVVVDRLWDQASDLLDRVRTLD